MKTLLTLWFVTGIALSATATSFTFRPNDQQGDSDDVFDLDHSYAYAWGINTDANQTNSPGKSLYNELTNGGYSITSAKLTISDIWDWKKEDDILYIHLLNGPTAGLKVKEENPYDHLNGDYFGQASRTASYYSPIGYTSQIFLTSWSDPVGGVNNGFDFTYYLTQSQLSVLSNWVKDGGTFGIGFDPDCHYYNTGIELKITTAPTPTSVPDGGSTLALLGITTSCLAWFRRKL